MSFSSLASFSDIISSLFMFYDLRLLLRVFNVKLIQYHVRIVGLDLGPKILRPPAKFH